LIPHPGPAVVVATAPQRSEGIVAGTQEVVTGSQAALFVVEEDEQE